MGPTVAALLFVAAALVAPPAARGGSCGPPEDDDTASICGFHLAGTVPVTEEGGLGQIEVRRRLAAVLQRDEGVVALLDLKSPTRPRVVGRYDDDAVDSLDGDLAFSTDGRWLFYARQTRQFSKDGIHVLDVSDPSQPRLADYQPQGGTLRIAYHDAGDAQWVFSLDATHGLVVHRFEPPTGALVPVHVDPLPATKVGGPASAGLVVSHDATLDAPLLYVTTGRTGLQVFDISDPALPQQLGAWTEEGLADIDVVTTGDRRIVYGASEYWFDAGTEPRIFVLDASELGDIRRVAKWGIGAPAEEPWRVQGLEATGRELLAAHSGAGLLSFNHVGRVIRHALLGGELRSGAGVAGAPHAMDVEASGRLLYLTDAATGTLAILSR